MFYLFWMILNIGLGFYFIYLCIKGGLYIRERMGLFATVLFAFGVMSFTFFDRNRDRDPGTQVRWESPFQDESLGYHPVKYKKITLTRNLMFSIQLKVRFRAINGIYEPYSASCNLEGTTGSYSWTADHISIQKLESKQAYEYEVVGTSTFKLLWANALSSSREYHGEFETD